MLKVFKKLRQKVCKHEFFVKDIELTKFKPLEIPSRDSSLKVWEKYFRELYDHRSVKKRVKCPCSKCGQIHYSWCGLSLKEKLNFKGSALARDYKHE